MKRRSSLVVTHTNLAGGFGPPQRKMRTLNRRRFSHQQPYMKPGERAGCSPDTTLDCSCSDGTVSCTTDPSRAHSAGQVEESAAFAVFNHVPELPAISPHATTVRASPFLLDASNSMHAAMDVDSNETASPNAAAYKHVGVQTITSNISCPLNDSLRAASSPESTCSSSGLSHHTQASQVPLEMHPPVGTLVVASWDSPNASSSSSSSPSVTSSPGSSAAPENVCMNSDEVFLPIESSAAHPQTPVHNRQLPNPLEQRGRGGLGRTTSRIRERTRFMIDIQPRSPYRETPQYHVDPRLEKAAGSPNVGLDSQPSPSGCESWPASQSQTSQSTAASSPSVPSPVDRAAPRQQRARDPAAVHVPHVLQA
ncbi:hypothetical protein NUW54_g129 [Trametes sanguinea]|uniref:Uncharacterized protein n=1 Tax=Trametes sanguinea TaxID=158606 RepID=A0ACC1QAA3_9APHY|nr:hypothetical protein NUW54_g129 [Trametes sanguinea]